METEKECPLCASRNVSYSEREKALMCRDCGTVITGTPVAMPQFEEVKEVIHDIPGKKELVKKIAKKKVVKKAKKKFKPKKKIKKAKKKVVKKKVKPKKKKSLLKRLLRR